MTVSARCQENFRGNPCPRLSVSLVGLVKAQETTGKRANMPNQGQRDQRKNTSQGRAYIFLRREIQHGPRVVPNLHSIFSAAHPTIRSSYQFITLAVVYLLG